MSDQCPGESVNKLIREGLDEYQKVKDWYEKRYGDWYGMRVPYPAARDCGWAQRIGSPKLLKAPTLERP